MTDLDIVKGLIDRNERITREFFFKRCQPLVYSLISKFFGGTVDYDEMVNELYIHLMEDDARRLRMYEGKCSIYQWVKIVSKNYFMDKTSHCGMIENMPDDRLYIKKCDVFTDNAAQEAEMDVNAILDQIENENYRLVLHKHVIEGMSFDELELLTGIKKANLYNIKKRALKAMEKIARIAHTQNDSLCSIRCEEFILHCYGIHKQLTELKNMALSEGWLTENGAYIDDLGNTALAFGLKISKKEKTTLQEIIQALADGSHVMAAVDGGELIGDPIEERLEDVLAGKIVDHCVVVLSVDVDADEVVLFDPAFGVIPLTVSLAHFMDAWEDSNYLCVLINK